MNQSGSRTPIGEIEKNGEDQCEKDKDLEQLTVTAVHHGTGATTAVVAVNSQARHGKDVRTVTIFHFQL